MKAVITKKTNAGKNSCALVCSLLLAVAFSGNSYAITDALKIKISSGSYSDETIIRFMPGATAGFDGCCDAWKMFSLNSLVPNIFTKTPDAEELTINALPPLTTSFTCSLFLRTGVSGYYSFGSKEVGAFAPGVCIRMYDQVTGSIYDLRDTNTVQSIYLPAISENDAARFTIVFSLPASVQTTEPTCMGCSDGIAIIKKTGWTNWQYTITDTVGTYITSGTSATDSIIINEFASGGYKVVVITQAFTCTDSVWFHVYEHNYFTGINNTPFQHECKFYYYDGAFRLETNFSEAKNFTAQIIDLEGRKIWEMAFSDTKQLKNTIEIGHIAPGVYSGVIQGKDFSSVKKLIVSR